MLTYDNTNKTLNYWGKKLQAKIRSFLRSNQFKATGKTINSVKSDLVRKDSLFTLSIRSKSKVGDDGFPIATVDAIDLGQRPSRKRLPPVIEIMEWIKAKGISIRRDERGGRFVKRSERNIQRAASAIAYSIRKGSVSKGNPIRGGTIKRYGYKGTGLYKKVISENGNAMVRAVSKAVLKDTGKALTDVMINLETEANKNSEVKKH